MNQQKKRVKLTKGKPGPKRKLTPDQLRKGVEAYFASISYLEPVEIEEPVILATNPETGAITYQRDSYGHIMFRRRPVTDANGRQLVRLKYTEPPGDYALCNFLKISKDTWDRYGHLAEELEAKASSTEVGAPPHPSAARTPSPQGEGLETGDAGGRADKQCLSLQAQKELEEAREYAEIYALARGRVCAYLERASEEKGASKGAVFKLERIYGLGEKKEVTVAAAGGVEEFLRNIGGEAEY